jgi:hypothetical protein
MARPASSEQHSFPAQRRAVSPNAFQCNRSTAGCPPSLALDLTPAQIVAYLLPDGWDPALFNHRTGLI